LKSCCHDYNVKAHLNFLTNKEKEMKHTYKFLTIITILALKFISINRVEAAGSS